MGDEDNNNPAQSKKIEPLAILILGVTILVYAVVSGVLNIHGVTSAGPLKLTGNQAIVAAAIGGLIALYGFLALTPALPALPFGRERTFAILGAFVTLVLTTVAWGVVFSVRANRLVGVGSDRLSADQRWVLVVGGALAVVLAVISLRLVWPFLQQTWRFFRESLVAVAVVVSFLLVWGPAQWLTPSPLLIADFTDTTDWYVVNNEWTHAIFDPPTSTNTFFRFYPPGNGIAVWAYREPVSDTIGGSLGAYCSAQFKIRHHPKGGEIGTPQQPPVFYLTHGNEDMIRSLADLVDPESTDWQEVTVRFFDLRGRRTRGSFSPTTPVSRLGFEFSSRTPGGTIDIDDVELVPCASGAERGSG
jgi:hypothetical protein